MADIRSTTPGAKGSAYPLQPNATYLGEVKVVYPDNTVGVYVKKLSSTFSHCKVVGSPLLKPIVKGDRVVCGLLDGLKQEMVVYGAYDTTGDTQPLQLRSDTAANWTSVNPTLAVGEIGFETDTGKFKIGTGLTAWTSLLYATDASDITGTITGGSASTVQANIQVRRDTAANWTSTNPTLAAGEIGFETDTGKFKIGTSTLRTYAIGDVGPGGGKIFITPSTAGNSTGQYFEVAPVGVEVVRDWATGANQSLDVTGADGSAIGTGAQNTIDIVAQSGNVAASSAAVYCSELVYGGKSDWFLPSWYELSELHANRIALNTNFNTSTNYYGSTELGTSNAIVVAFGDGQPLNGSKVGPWSVRPVRSFTVTPGWEYAPYATAASDIDGSFPSLAVIGTTTASSFLQSADYLSPHQGFRNFLINGGFNIWQRGTSSASTGVTTADRWYNLVSGTTTFSQDAVDYPIGVGVRYSNKWTTGASSSFGQIFQAIESPTVIPLRNSTMTFSAWVKRGASITGSLYFQAFYSTSSDAYASQTVGIGVANAQIIPTTSWVRYSCTFVVPPFATGLKVGIVPTNVQASGVVVLFAGMQLEKGHVATPFEQRPIGIELALCQRYYFATDNASAVSTANVYHYNAFPVVMRARPTITYTVAGGFTTGNIGVNGFYTINGSTTAYNFQAAIEL